MITGMAFEQLIDAMDCKQSFRNAGYHVDLSFGFYLRMGGFYAQDDRDSKPYQLDWRQAYVKVTDHQIRIPRALSTSLSDTTKNGVLVKTITCLQALWFFVRCIARISADLPMSQLELSTIAYVVVSLLTYLCWWHKPLDVTERKLIRRSAKGCWEIVGEEELLLGHDAIEGVKKCERTNFARPTQVVDSAKDADIRSAAGSSRQDNIRIRNMDSRFLWPAEGDTSEGKWSKWFFDTLYHFASRFLVGSMVSMLAGLVFGGIQVCAWNFHFPSRIESLLWQACTLVITFVHVFAFSSYLVTNLLNSVFGGPKPWSWLTAGHEQPESIGERHSQRSQGSKKSPQVSTPSSGSASPTSTSVVLQRTCSTRTTPSGNYSSFTQWCSHLLWSCTV